MTTDNIKEDNHYLRFIMGGITLAFIIVVIFTFKSINQLMTLKILISGILVSILIYAIGYIEDELGLFIFEEE